jgi:uncharacterized protein (DUF697 family)
MNRKKLPRVITPSGGAIRDALASGASDLRAAQPVKSDLVGAQDDMARNVGTAHKIAVVTPLPEPPSGPQGAPAQRRRPAVGVNAVRRRARALRIVNRHAGYSAVGGIIPLPLANFAGVTAAIVRMVKVLSVHYNVPFEQDRARAIVIGLVAGAMPSGLATVTSSALVHVVPGGTFVGLAVASLSAAACTRSIGRVFVEHFENGATLVDFPSTRRLQAR